MNRIRLLSEQVANQIAAGEVVERPSSVVKELVENAIDAKSRRICVEIQSGGRSLIRVTDDGTGMSRDDALLCLERHATSKIQLASDLSSISTMGFRGEALPSIASVSRFSLTTREQGDPNPEATQVIVQGGKVVEVKSVGAPSGTCIEVRQLFFNVPARKKFLRSDETEFAHIQHGLSLAALAHPSVGFTLIRDGKTLWQLPPGKPEGEGAGRPFDALSERLRSLLSDDGRHLKVDFQTELPELPMRSTLQDPDAFVDLRTRNLRIWGFIGRPGVSRASRDQHFIFVNRRPVENRGIHYALIEGYHTSLMKGRYPVCCLFLEIDPARVDVNIHPTKREVKFHSEGDIRRLTAEAVRQALLSFHRSAPGMTPAIGFSPSQATPRENPPPAQPAPAAGEVHTDPVVHPVAQAMELPALALDPLLSTTAPTPQVVVPQNRQENPFATRTGSVAAPASAATSSPTPFTPVPPAQNLSSGGPEVRPVFAPTPPLQEMKPVPLLRVPLRIVGVVGRLYVVMESDRGMVLMDQHAAHERVLFEQMLQRLEKNAVPSQRLLLPETVELSVRDALWMREALPTLTRLGVGLSEFGERTFLLDGLPAIVKSSDPKRFVIDLIDQLRAAGQDVNSMRLGEEVIAKTVCRHAVKANDPLSLHELEGLLRDLRRCDMPYTCPHGRPTLIEMSHRELEKKFGRTVA